MILQKYEITTNICFPAGFQRCFIEMKFVIPKEDTALKCPFCGDQCEEGALYCDVCRQALPTEQDDIRKPKKKKYKRSKTITAIFEFVNDSRIARKTSYIMPRRKPKPREATKIVSCSD